MTNVLCWIILLLFIMAFMYSADENSQEYDECLLQYVCFDKYINSKIPAFVQYVGDDRTEIQHNQYTLITIDYVDDAIRVQLEDTYISYDDLEQFNYDWRFEDAE